MHLYNNEHENVIIDVVQANPMLLALYFCNTGKRRNRIRYYLHMSQAGRVLLGNDKVSPSFWSMVIERVNCLGWEKADKASTIYGLLHHSDIAHVPVNSTLSKKDEVATRGQSKGFMLNKVQIWIAALL